MSGLCSHTVYLTIDFLTYFPDIKPGRGGVFNVPRSRCPENGFRYRWRIRGIRGAPGAFSRSALLEAGYVAPPATPYPGRSGRDSPHRSRGLSKGQSVSSAARAVGGYLYSD